MKRRSLKSLAEETGYSVHHLSRTLNGYQPASAALREAISRALGVPEEQLFHPTPPVPRFPGDAAVVEATK
jgi:transcriptional regulator with XRE-family HTH domain